ncbi:hypothetical protein N8314_03745 [Akkermansiaceae bacterium]|nr:hypothetical protein [Akkermansiaceae bacterium]
MAASPMLLLKSPTTITLSAWMKQQGDDGHLTGEGIKYAETEFAE